MTTLRKIALTILTVTFLTPIIMAMFSFFGLPFETYANYILWMVALGFFVCIIPVGQLDTFR